MKDTMDDTSREKRTRGVSFFGQTRHAGTVVVGHASATIGLHNHAFVGASAFRILYAFFCATSWPSLPW